MQASFVRLWAVVHKDVRSEIRTRYGLSAMALFVVTTVMLIAFSIADEPIPRPMAAGLLWVVMTFTGMSGLGRGFVREEETGTWLYLRLTSTPSAVLMGKLIVNLAQALITNLFALALLAIVVGPVFTGNVVALGACTTVCSLCLASVFTIMSAIAARTEAGGLLLPVLSVPLLLPVALPGTAAIVQALAGFSVGEVAPNLGIIMAYSGVLLVVSWLVFDYVWEG